MASSTVLQKPIALAPAEADMAWAWQKRGKGGQRPVARWAPVTHHIPSVLRCLPSTPPRCTFLPGVWLTYKNWKPKDSPDSGGSQGGCRFPQELPITSACGPCTRPGGEASWSRHHSNNTGGGRETGGVCMVWGDLVWDMVTSANHGPWGQSNCWQWRN